MKKTTKIASLRELAELVGRSKSTVHGWTQQPTWPVRPAPPWTAADLEAIAQWREGLREDRTGVDDEAAQQAADDKYYEEHSLYLLGDLPELVKEPGCTFAAHDPRRHKLPVCTPYERQLIDGKKTLTPKQVRLLVAYVVNLKMLMIQDAGWLPNWCEGLTRQQIRRRWAGTLLERLDWFNERLPELAKDTKGEALADRLRDLTDD